MFYGIQFKSGYATQLPFVGTKAFKFTEGVNVLYGSNGSGKSTILKTLAAYGAIPKAGWSRVSEPTTLGTYYIGRMQEAKDFPHAYSYYAPGRCEANVGWDGMPVFMNSGNIQVSDTFFFQNAGQSEDGITSEAEQFDALVRSPSSGQYRIEKMNQILGMMTNSPLTIGQMETLPPRCAYPESAKREIKYWNLLGRKSKRMTILLDEPERSLSLPMQYQLLVELIPNLLKNYQVIIATHSLFALSMKDTNIIDMDNGYVRVCKELIERMCKNAERNSN